MKDRMTLVATVVVALLFLLTIGVPTALADSCSGNTCTYNLANSNLGSGFNGSFGTVTITWVNGTTADVTFQANDSGVGGSAAGYQFIDSQAADLNVNSTNFSVGTFSDTQLATFHGQDTTQWTKSSGNVDGFGTFNLQVNTQDGSGSAMDTISFVLTDVSGTWANAAAVLALNGNGNDVAAHVAACTGTPCSINNTGATTGYASQGTSVHVPDGGVTLMLLGGALVGIETLRRKFRA